MLQFCYFLQDAFFNFLYWRTSDKKVKYNDAIMQSITSTIFERPNQRTVLEPSRLSGFPTKLLNCNLAAHKFFNEPSVYNTIISCWYLTVLTDSSQPAIDRVLFLCSPKLWLHFKHSVCLLLFFCGVQFHNYKNARKPYLTTNTPITNSYSTRSRFCS